MTEVICINDKGISPKIANRPKEGEIYTIRQLVRNVDSSWGVLLNEVRNPKHIVVYDYGMTLSLEPNFALYRFTDLLGNTLDGDELFKKEREDSLVESGDSLNFVKQ